MGRHHINQVCRRLLQKIRPHPLPVHGNLLHRIPYILKRAEGLQIGGRLHGHPASPAQDLGKKDLQIFVSGADHDLPRPAVHIPGLIQIITDDLPQVPVAEGRAASQQTLPLVQKQAAHDSSHGRVRKMLQVNPVGRKIHRILLRRVQRFFRDGRRLLPAVLRQVIQISDVADIISPVRLRFQIAFRQKLVIRQLHRTPAAGEKLRLRTGGGELLPPGNPSGQNRVTDSLINLLIIRFSVFRIQTDRKFFHK